MNKTLREILKRHREWDLLILIRSNSIKVFDALDTATESYSKYISKYTDVICNYVMFNYGRVNLLIIAMNTDIDYMGRC